jgi:hypothetical protein
MKGNIKNVAPPPQAQPASNKAGPNTKTEISAQEEGDARPQKRPSLSEAGNGRKPTEKKDPNAKFRQIPESNLENPRRSSAGAIVGGGDPQQATRCVELRFV